MQPDHSTGLCVLFDNVGITKLMGDRGSLSVLHGGWQGVGDKGWVKRDRGVVYVPWYLACLNHVKLENMSAKS